MEETRKEREREEERERERGDNKSKDTRLLALKTEGSGVKEGRQTPEPE